jgi:integrase
VIFLLAVAAGLRRKEIDLLEWSPFRWEENVIRIQPRAKSREHQFRAKLVKRE